MLMCFVFAFKEVYILYGPSCTFWIPSSFKFVSEFVFVGDVCACINAATMALVDAGIPMNDFVSASSAGYIEDNPMLGKCGIP